MAKKRLTKVQKGWLEALWSGKYKQTRGCLRNNDTFCCLGVACDIYAKEKKVKWGHKRYGATYFMGSDDLLPSSVKEWLGLFSESGRVKQGPYANLTALNDYKKLTFKQIADFIDNNREKVFK